MEVFDAHDLLDDTGASLLATSFQEGWVGDKHLLVDKKESTRDTLWVDSGCALFRRKVGARWRRPPCISTVTPDKSEFESAGECKNW